MAPREIALWHWSQVENLDRFLGEVYEYYRLGGIYCICLARLFQKLTVVFIVTTAMYLSNCINYSKIHHHSSLQQVVVPKCMSRTHGMPIFIIWCLAFWFIYQSTVDIIDIVRLRRMHNFYLHLLHVPDVEIQTIEWREVISRLMDLRDLNPNVNTKKQSPLVKQFMGPQSKARLDAHDVANRLMRKENYLIAMFNKDIIDLSLPFSIPFVDLGAKQLLRSLALYGLNWVIFDFFFDRNGQLNPIVLKTKERRRLTEALQRRFTFIGVIGIAVCPLIVVYSAIYFFYRNFTEVKNNEPTVGAKRYTPWAQLQYREYNELPHLFNKRLNMSHVFASRYLNQFPKRKTSEVANFVTLVSGGFLSILGVGFFIFSEEHFWSFQLFGGRPVLWYMTGLGAIWGLARSMVADETEVFEPEYILRQVISYTRYMPTEWKGRLHTDEVRAEFAEMYQLRLVSLIWELVADLLSPLICFGGLYTSSERIVDFFHGHTVHVEGLGHVCSDAVFDFEKGPKTGAAGPAGVPAAGEGPLDDYYLSKHGKMAASYFGFLDNYATNPKVGIVGHVPPGMSPEMQGQNYGGFNPPPAWPGMEGMEKSGIRRLARSRPALSRSVIPGQIGKRQHMAASAALNADLPHLPNLPPLPHESSFGTGTRKSVYNPARSRFQARNVVEEYDEEMDTGGYGERMDKGKGKMMQSRFGAAREISDLDKSMWETSPRKSRTEEEQREMEEDALMGGEGVLGMLMQVKRAGTSNRPGVNL